MRQKIKIAVEFETEVDTSDKYFADNLAQRIEGAVVNAFDDIKPTHDWCFMLDSAKDYKSGNLYEGAW